MKEKKRTVPLAEYPRRGTLITLLFNFYVITWWLEVGKRVGFLGQIRFEFLIAALLGFIIVFHPVKMPQLDPAEKRIVKGIFFYFLALLISLIISQDFSRSLDIVVNRVLKLAAMTLFMTFFIQSPRHLWYFLISTFASYFKVGQETFRGRITGSMVWENQGIMRLNGPTNSMFGDPNSLSGKTVSLLPYLWFLFPLIKKYWKVIVLIQVIFAINIIVFTGSRTGYLATCTMLLAFWWYSAKKGKLFLGLIVLLLVTLFAVPTQYKARFMSSFEGKEAEGHSKQTRVGLLHDAALVFMEYPYGVGPGCFIVVQARAGRNEQETHNLYTQILTEIGFQGFIAFVYFIYSVVKSLRITREKGVKTIRKLSLPEHQLKGMSVDLQNLFSSEKKKLKMLHAVCDGTLVFLFIRGVLGIFGHDLYEIYWWIAAGLALVLANIQKVADKRSEELVSCLVNFV